MTTPGGCRQSGALRRIRVYVTHTNRGQKRLRLFEVGMNGSARMILEETGKTYVELNIDSNNHRANWQVLNGGEDILWVSERDGWAHLYRFDGTGRLKNQITSGQWPVGEIIRVEEDKGLIYFTGRGREKERDPYFEHLYKVKFDGTGLELLTPEPSNHTIDVAPGGQYIVDMYSRVDQPPVTVLRGGRPADSQADRGGRFEAAGDGLALSRAVQRQGAGWRDGSLRRALQTARLRSEQEVSTHRQHLPWAAVDRDAQELRTARSGAGAG